MLYTLIGMPGSGKSCMGRALASKLKMKLIDTDKLIEKRCGEKLQSIINRLGVEEFRRIEEEVLTSIEDTDGIVSTGGSAVYSRKAMEFFRSRGKVFYLYCSYKTIEQRIGDFSKRGVVLKPGQDLYGLYRERCPLYERYAHHTVLCDGTAYPRYQAFAIKLIERYRREEAEAKKSSEQNSN
jgi:shikimate kinase